MSGLKRKEEEIGLVELDADKEEESSRDSPAFQRAAEQKSKAVRMALAAMIAGGLLLILLGTLVFHIPLITAGFVVVIEAVIASALNNSPFWVHVVIMALQVVMGFFGTDLISCAGGGILFFAPAGSKAAGGRRIIFDKALHKTWNRL